MSAGSFVQRHWLASAIAVIALIVTVNAIIHYVWPPGEALHVALKTLIDGKDADKALVAAAIWSNYEEARENAWTWSGAYFGCSFVAVALSATAGLILKFEFFIEKEELKKDLAAIFSVLAAVLITISTSGDFQRKWQANRVAAAELERVGYRLLEDSAGAPRHYLAAVSKTLHDRHLAIVGLKADPKSDQERTDADGTRTTGGSP